MADDSEPPPLASPSERTPLFSVVPGPSSGLGSYEGIPGSEMGDPSSRSGFGGRPTARERTWYKAKQFKSLLVSLLVCTIIAVIVVLAVVVGNRSSSGSGVGPSSNSVSLDGNNGSGNVAAMVPGTESGPVPMLKSSFNRRGADFLNTSGLLPPASSPFFNFTTTTMTNATTDKPSTSTPTNATTTRPPWWSSWSKPASPAWSSAWPSGAPRQATEREFADAIAFGRRQADKLRDFVDRHPYTAPMDKKGKAGSRASLRPEDLYRATKDGRDVRDKLADFAGYVVDAAARHLVATLNMTKEQALDVQFWNMMPSIGLMINQGYNISGYNTSKLENATDYDQNATIIHVAPEHIPVRVVTDNATGTVHVAPVGGGENASRVAGIFGGGEGEENATTVRIAPENIAINVVPENTTTSAADYVDEYEDESKAPGAADRRNKNPLGAGAVSLFDDEIDPALFNCSATERFRRFDGLCNNLRHPMWGAAGAAYRRMLPADYDDGVSRPRSTSSDGVTPLPSPRRVSRTLHRSDYREEPGVSMLFVMWGQLIDHDMEASVNIPGDIDCCANATWNTGNVLHDTNRTDIKIANNTADTANSTDYYQDVQLQEQQAVYSYDEQYQLRQQQLMMETEQNEGFSECFPILVDPEDAFYGPKNVTCMSIVRDAVAPRLRLGPREQMNANTAYLDASMVYGRTEDDLGLVRAYGQNGTLAATKLGDGRKMLPLTNRDGCSTDTTPSETPRCHFGAGDARVEENMGLTSFHTLLVREHNRIAEQLFKLNPDWDDERIFQEARRIVIAEIQHITYNEYLPLLLGRTWETEAAARNKIFSSKSTGSVSATVAPPMVRTTTESAWSLFWRRPTSTTPWRSADQEFDSGTAPTGTRGGGGRGRMSRANEYQEDLDPTIANVFAGAAFRFGHSTVQGLIKMMMEAHTIRSEENIPLHEVQFNTSRLYGAGQMDALLRGYSEESSRRTDRFFTAQMTNHLFETQNTDYGLDLVSINIQRGRDRGLPSYTAWRKHCGLRPIRDFSDLENAFGADTADLFRSVYKSVDDIDPFTGMVSERRLSKSLVGPTLKCLLGDQFYRLKYGDRFWYDFQSSPYPFTKGQLAEIKKVSLASLICQNSDGIGELSPYPMQRSPMRRDVPSSSPGGDGTSASTSGKSPSPSANRAENDVADNLVDYPISKSGSSSFADDYRVRNKKVSCSTIPAMQLVAWEHYKLSPNLKLVG